MPSLQVHSTAVLPCTAYCVIVLVEAGQICTHGACVRGEIFLQQLYVNLQGQSTLHETRRDKLSGCLVTACRVEALALVSTGPALGRIHGRVLHATAGVSSHLIVARGAYAGSQVGARRRQCKGNNGAVLLDFLHGANCLPVGRGH